MLNYHTNDLALPFSDYLQLTRNLIANERVDLIKYPNPDFVITANAPYQLVSSGKTRCGVLLIHGLLDCPFSMLEIAQHLQTKGMLCRSILLPGHGTKPTDLLPVTYTDWMQAVIYGVESLKKEVDRIILVGYSTGAALSILHAYKDPAILGIVTLAPAIQIKAPVEFVLGCHSMLKGKKDLAWIFMDEENDYTKYQSIGFHPVQQVAALGKLIRSECMKIPFMKPLLMVLTKADETVSTRKAMQFFAANTHQKSELLLYTNKPDAIKDSRIMTRTAKHPDFHIKNISHVGMPFSPHNSHYGQEGDYANASRRNLKDVQFGAYNRIEEKAYDTLYEMGFSKMTKHTLTYNPDFDFLATKIADFIEGLV